MSLWNDLKKWIVKWGAYTYEKDNDKYSTYTPDPAKGYWKNVGSIYEEDWRWIEPIIPLTRKRYVAVTEPKKDKYHFIICDEKEIYHCENLLECVDCYRDKEIYWAINMYEAYYRVLGKVSMDETCQKIMIEFDE
jgi:hypothetical protein